MCEIIGSCNFSLHLDFHCLCIVVMDSDSSSSTSASEEEIRNKKKSKKKKVRPLNVCALLPLHPDWNVPFSDFLKRSQSFD